MCHKSHHGSQMNSFCTQKKEDHLERNHQPSQCVQLWAVYLYQKDCLHPLLNLGRMRLNANEQFCRPIFLVDNHCRSSRYFFKFSKYCVRHTTSASFSVMALFWLRWVYYVVSENLFSIKEAMLHHYWRLNLFCWS